MMNKNESPKKPRRISLSISQPELSSLAPLNKNISESSKQINDAYRTLFHAPPSYRLLIRDIIKADISIITKKSFLLCPHRHHCIQNAFMKGFWRTFAACFIFKTSLSLFHALFFRKLINFRNGTISWKMLSKICLSQDSLLFAQIFGLMSFSYKVILCFLRRYRLRDPIWHKTVAGFISGIWILLDNRNRRNTIALYCIFRAISDLFRLCVSYGNLPNIQNFDVITFTASQMIIGYCFKDSTGFDRGYYKWITYMGNVTEDQIQNVVRSPSGAINRLHHEPFVECYPLWHPHPSCLLYNIKNSYVGVFFKAIKMYFPVHFIPTLLLSPKKIFAQPIGFVKKKSWATIVSALFLSTYVFNISSTVCIMRNILRDDPWWIFCVGGFFAGLSLFVENIKRRSEIALYCIPRAMEWSMRKVEKNKLPTLYKLLRSNLLPTLVFQIAMAIWLSIWNIPRGIKNSNTINMTVLKILFGTKH